MNWTDAVPVLLWRMVLTVVLAFVLGLELHSYRVPQGKERGYGTTRTLTLLALLGFALPEVGVAHAWLAGLAAVGALFALYYHRRLREGHDHLLAILIGLAAYVLGGLGRTAPLWLLFAYTAVIIVLLSAKWPIRRLSESFRLDDATALAKFLVMAGIVYPFLPPGTITPFIPVTYGEVWLAVLVVSGVSYASYLAQLYLWPRGGPMITAVLGGLYSSTVATVVLARRAREDPATARRLGAAVVVACSMMYPRLWVLVLAVGGSGTALGLAPAFAVFTVASLVLGWAWLRRERAAAEAEAAAPSELHNPLQLSTALAFGALFAGFTALTHFIMQRYGAGGLRVLSFATGVTDVAPFVLSVTAGRFHVPQEAIVAAVLIASGSNNLVKAVYARVLSGRRAVWPAVAWLFFTFLASVALGLFVYA